MVLLQACRSVVCDRQTMRPTIWLPNAGVPLLRRARLFLPPLLGDSLRVCASAVLTAAAMPGLLLMTGKRTGGQSRIVWTRSRSTRNGHALTSLDQSLLGVLCAHRVVTQAQLVRLFPDVPERTLRYRTRRLHDLGLTGRSRPYREEGSAPNHHWPTRRADCLMRGDPVPRGGERKRPNPVFLAHATALTEMYVTLATRAGEASLTLEEYRREGDAREPFTHERKDRALAPDAMVILTDSDGREFRAFVEIDLGTMSHARLRHKAELYATYVASEAWREWHPFLPALLFLTTTDIRAGRFLKALAGMLRDGPRSKTRTAFVAAGAGAAWAPSRLLDGLCLADLDGHTGLALLDVLNAARAPYEQATAAQRRRKEAEEQKRRQLQTQPEAMRKHLCANKATLRDYARRLGPAGEQTFELLLASEKSPTLEERTALNALARDLDQARCPTSGRATFPNPPAQAPGSYSRPRPECHYC